MLSQNQIALLINTFSQLTTNTNYVAVTKINTGYRTTQYFNYEGHRVKPLIDLYSGNNVVILQDTSNGNYYAIREDFDPVLSERTFTRKYQEERKKIVSKQVADVAVLLCCEKEDAYDFWITWLGDRRRNRFAYVGEMPKRLQTEQYWAWESNQGGRFEFNPYAGATGGGISISTTPNNYDGAVIGVGPEGAFYQSEGWNGGGDIGGVVTPTWSRVLTDYSVTARTYLQTLCYPLDMYTDVTWEWSDGGGGYALRKVSGDGVTTSSSDKTIGTTWDVSWSYAGGGGSVSVSQVPAPLVQVKSPDDPILYYLRTESGAEFYSETPFSIQRDQRQKGFEPGVYYRYITCNGVLGGAPPLTDDNDDGEFDDIPGEAYIVGGNDTIWRSYRNTFSGGGWSGFSDQPFRTVAGFVVQGDCSGSPTDIDNFYTPFVTLELFKLPNEPFDIYEHRLQVYSGGSILYDSGWGEREDDPFTDIIEPPPTYTITIKDEDNIEVASDSAATSISHVSTKEEDKRVSFYIKQDGENINGQFDASTGPIPGGFEDGDDIPEEYRDFELESGESAPTVTGETRLVIARVDAWVEVAGKKLAAVTLNGRDGNTIIESPQYEDAIKPYAGPDGRTVFPCYPQKTQDPPKEESASFQAEDGFNAYHITWYNTRGESVGGKTTDYVPFDFGNPDLSGQLPSPSINYLFSLISTDLEIEYEPKGFLSWVKDLPEEGASLEEEQESGVDPYGVVYSLVKGFTYALYGPTKTGQSTTSKVIDGDAGETLLGNYDFTLFSFRNRQRKPRLYVLNPDKTDEGRPFEEYDISDPDQRGLHQLLSTMGETFRRELWGYDLSPVANEYEEDWATERVTFERNPSGGDTPFERQYLNNETANSSTVKQRGDKTLDITVKIADVRALLKKTQRGDVEFTIHDSQRPNETTTQVFKMNPIRDVFDGYSEVKILAAAGVIY